MRDAYAVDDFAAMVWSQVRRESIVSDAVVDPGGDILVADSSVRVIGVCTHCKFWICSIAILYMCAFMS